MGDIIDLAVIGAGPAGMTAGIYASRAGHQVVLFEKMAAGGQAALTNHIENYPGFPEGINGYELTAKMQQQTERFGSRFVYDSIENLHKEKQLWVLTSGTGAVYYAKAVLITSGASSRKTGAQGEEKFFGRGIGTCAVCDGAFYKDKTVAVIGGGNSALEESVYLSKIVKKIYLVHRRREYRADKIVQDQFEKLENVELVLDSVVEEFKGTNKLDTLVVKNVKTNIITELPLDGAFLYVGLIPNTDWLQPAYKTAEGFIQIQADGTIKGTEGLFAAGDCCEGAVKQVAAAVGRGTEVSYSIGRYLETLH